VNPDYHPKYKVGDLVQYERFHAIILDVMRVKYKTMYGDFVYKYKILWLECKEHDSRHGVFDDYCRDIDLDTDLICSLDHDD
jgi:hypothetical protein